MIFLLRYYLELAMQFLFKLRFQFSVSVPYSIIATSIVHSNLDYCNFLFLNLDSTQIQRMQLIQNSLAVTRTSRHHHITPVLKSLHWLKIPERISTSKSCP